MVVDDREGIQNYPVPNNFTASQKSWALVFIRKHIDDSFEQQYLHIKGPTHLWMQLEAKFCHKKTIFLPKACNDWANLKVYDFSDISSYNKEMFKIVSQLHLCGEDKTDEDMIEKTLSTFPTAATMLA